MLFSFKNRDEFIGFPKGLRVRMAGQMCKSVLAGAKSSFFTSPLEAGKL